MAGSRPIKRRRPPVEGARQLKFEPWARQTLEMHKLTGCALTPASRSLSLRWSELSAVGVPAHPLPKVSPLPTPPSIPVPTDAKPFVARKRRRHSRRRRGPWTSTSLHRNLRDPPSGLLGLRRQQSRRDSRDRCVGTSSASGIGDRCVGTYSASLRGHLLGVVRCGRLDADRRSGIAAWALMRSECQLVAPPTYVRKVRGGARPRKTTQNMVEHI